MTSFLGKKRPFPGHLAFFEQRIITLTLFLGILKHLHYCSGDIQKLTFYSGSLKLGELYRQGYGKQYRMGIVSRWESISEFTILK